MEGLSTVVLNAVGYAKSLLPDAAIAGQQSPIEAVHVTDDLDAGRKLQEDWNKASPGVPLIILDSPYRNRVGALLRYLDLVERRQAQPGAMVTVLLPEIIPTKLWQLFLHNGTALHLKSLLLVRPHTTVISVPRRVSA